MKRTILLLVALSLLAASGSPAGAHRAACHTKHECPSDHASYKWRGWLCVSPTADERKAAFKKRIVYDKRVYFCRR